MNKAILFISVISLFLSGCGNHSHEKTKEGTETVTAQEHLHDQENDAIELNQGEKWIVDANMKPYIRNMENDINAFDDSEQKDYKLLSEKLQSNIDLLTSNCTMKGKAHDELHKWLLPYIDIVNKLSESKDQTEAANEFENIKTSLITFNQYFQ